MHPWLQYWYLQDAVRVTVLEMKNDQGDKLACGVVTQDTKVVLHRVGQDIKVVHTK